MVSDRWKELKASDTEIGTFVGQHVESLRVFRIRYSITNEAHQKHLQFVDADKFNWAEQMQSEY